MRAVVRGRGWSRPQVLVHIQPVTSGKFFHGGPAILSLSSSSKTFSLHKSFLIMYHLVITAKPPEESDAL